MNKTQNIILAASIVAAADLAARRLVGFDGDVCAAGAKAFGVADVDTAAGNVAPANVLGIMLVEAGGAIAAGTQVEAGAEGKAVVLDAGASNGFALDAALADGDLIRIVRGI